VGQVLNSLKNDPALDHPKAGAAARNQKEKLARMDAERACILIVGRDAVLAQIAREHGDQRAIDCAEVFGLSATEYIALRDMKQQQVRQATRRYGPTWDADEDPRVIKLLQDGRATMDQINQARRQAINEHNAQEQKIIGPGSFHDEPEAPLPQRTLTSSNPAAAFNADLDAAAARARSTQP
jgi:hypothetical protein